MGLRAPGAKDAISHYRHGTPGTPPGPARASEHHSSHSTSQSSQSISRIPSRAPVGQSSVGRVSAKVPASHDKDVAAELAQSALPSCKASATLQAFKQSVAVRGRAPAAEAAAGARAASAAAVYLGPSRSASSLSTSHASPSGATLSGVTIGSRGSASARHRKVSAGPLTRCVSLASGQVRWESDVAHASSHNVLTTRADELDVSWDVQRRHGRRAQV
jgi:hypothetical protein